MLDVGCGRGAVLILAAHRLPRGNAVGVDIWRARDQSADSHAATERNAVLEGVDDRVEVIDADARELPFPTASFDLVVSSITIHNIADEEGRNRALVEATRVLRPGGQLLELTRILELADELGEGTIERQLAKSDVELGLEQLLRSDPRT